MGFCSKMLHFTPEIFQNDITFSNISFRYPARENITVLNQLCLDIPAGKTTALVGPSGSGKSTIVGLLVRWYDASSGQITIGKSGLHEFPLQALRASIGLVQQVLILSRISIYR